jgi:hypothetical protein
MSSLALPDLFPSHSTSAPETRVAVAARTGKPRKNSGFVRRRSTPEQGRALETLGHAVEYLMDSGLFLRDDRNPQAEQQAIQILMRLSRAVFAECAIVVPLRVRMRLWVQRKVGTVFKVSDAISSSHLD